MAYEYIINFTGSINGLKPSFTIEPRTVDNTTSLTLYGKGAPSYGAGMQENLIYLLENFCNQTPPMRPTEGQLWYNSTTKTLNACHGYDSGHAPIWVVISGVTASTVSPTSPTSPTTGQLWYNVTTSLMYIWSDGVWKPLTSSNTNNTTTAPTSPVAGTLWYNPTLSSLLVWDGTAWISLATLSDVIDNAIMFAIALG